MALASLAHHLRYNGKLGKLARGPLALVPKGMTIPILSGANRNMRWINGAGPSRACWLGHYESDHLQALPKLVLPGSIAYDVGANAGFYTLALSKLVGPAGHVFAFEPEATNVHFLRRHLELNLLTNVTIIQAAVNGGNDLVGFEGAAAGGSIGGRSSHYLVPSISLDEFARNHPAPQFIKMDIEGAEFEALRGASDLLQLGPAICLAVHTRQLNDECRNLLADRGYRFLSFDCESPAPERGDFIALRKASPSPTAG